MKALLTAILALVSFAITAAAQVKVADANDGAAIQCASVFDTDNTLIGLTDKHGLLPKTGHCKTIVVRHISYEPAVVKLAEVVDGVIRLTPRQIELGEVAVYAPKYKHQRIKGYYRLYSTTGNDIVQKNSIEEGNLLWMMPIEKGKTIEPKIYTVRKYTATIENSDTTYRFQEKNNDNYSLLATISLALRSGSVRDADWTKGLDHDSEADTLSGKYYPIAIHRRIGNTDYYQHDQLANNKDHTLSFAMLKLLGWNVDFTTWMTSLTYQTDSLDRRGNITNSCTNFGGRATGKMYRKHYGGKEADQNIILEVYYYDLQYMTTDEAKADKKIKRYGKIEIPANAPQYDYISNKLIERSIASKDKSLPENSDEERM